MESKAFLVKVVYIGIFSALFTFLACDKKDEIVKGREPVTVLIQGDSRMANWAMPWTNVVNIAQGGSYIETQTENLQKTTYGKPMRLIMAAGINSLRRGDSVEYDIYRYSEYLEEALKRFEKKDIYCLAQAPLNTPLCIKLDQVYLNMPYDKVIEFNTGLELLCQKRGVHYIDACTALVEDRELNPDYTKDGVHFNAEGYEVLQGIIQYIFY